MAATMDRPAGRTRRKLTAAALLIALAACDGGGVIDQSLKQGLRQSAIQACVSWVPESEIAAAAGLSSERVCACAADRMLEGEAINDVADLRPDSPANQAAIAQCIADLQPAAPPAEETWSGG